MSSPSGSRITGLTASLRSKIADHAFELRVLREAGILGPVRPDKAVKMGATFLRWGASPATGAKIEAIHHPHETGADRRARIADVRRGAHALQRDRQCAGADGHPVR